MNAKDTLIEEYKGELAELEYAYHVFTNVAGNHFDTKAIVKALQTEIIDLSSNIRIAQAELDAHNEQFKGEKEFDKYAKDNY